MILFPHPPIRITGPYWRLAFFATTLSLAPVISHGAAAARLTINSGSGSIENSSTNTGGSFQLENLSTSGEKILSARIDLSTAMLPDVVFDPAGTAGDPDGKAFEQDSFNGTGTPTHAFESPHDGIGSEDGYDALRVNFGAGVSFGPGKKMTFSADIDPTNVKGAPGPGPDHAASVSGLELIGATITVTFDDDTTRVVRMGGVPGHSNKNLMSQGVLSASNLATPVISVTGKASPFTLNANPTVRVTGPAGASARLCVAHSELHLPVDGGYDVDPYESNKVVVFDPKSVTIGAGGFVDFPLTLAHASAPDGIKLLSAILVDGSGNRSSCSNIITIDYDPSGSGSGSSDSEPPEVPENFAASAVTAGSVTLGWTAPTDNVGVTGYRIYRGAADLGTTQQTTFTDHGRSPSTAYTYQVKAYDAANNHSEAASTTATTSADSQAPSPPGTLQAAAGNGAVQLTWTAASDEVGVTGYRIRRNGNPNPIATVSGLTLTHTDTGLSNGTTYTFDVRAIDAAGNESLPATVNAIPTLAPAATLRVNVGSNAAYVDPQGNTWAADYGSNTGYTDSNTAAITGTDKPALYQKRRIDRDTAPELTYGFAVSNGDYRVVLHFVEVVASVSVVGGRVFDVTAEGALAIDNLDIFAQVGANKALVVEVPVTVSDGQLNIGFLHVVQNPVLSGIEVFPVLPVVSPPTFEEWLTSHGLTGQTTTDSDGGGASNLAEYELQLDPNDAQDDLAFHLRCEALEGSIIVVLPELKPLGNYYVHRSDDPTALGDVANRIATFTRAQIEAMTPQQRTEQSVTGSAAGEKGFYQLFFEPGGG
ncbi:malectin domain-containing carbohydrate-binding protein [Luteolibacter arcticus]|uniref:Malectin domain-containing carbohydrate-binding protein n=1 Tax=Luteolibacter arcticus TaxID=1581411 RepID=A0ABT3GJG0_9BACT|nr:malectin domain-containing carbohydrate-binding protein [Luteolibacter arcticus]MCW1923658.1 malectin domain-containing carbohydrate-binding protein [Luteolibacter arcticus]